jgi:hypothetical protein
MSLLERLQTIRNTVGTDKTGFVSRLGTKGVSANVGETYSSLIGKISQISLGTDYRLVLGSTLSSASSVTSGNSGAKVTKQKQFVVPFSTLGTSAGNCIILSGIGMMYYTSGSAGITASSVELAQTLPFWSISVPSSTSLNFNTWSALTSAVVSNGAVSRYPSSSYNESLTYAPITGSYSTSEGTNTYTAAIPGNGNTGSAANPSSILGFNCQPFQNISMLTDGRFYLTFFTGNATYDYEYTGAIILMPIYAIKNQ